MTTEADAVRRELFATLRGVVEANEAVRSALATNTAAVSRMVEEAERRNSLEEARQKIEAEQEQAKGRALNRLLDWSNSKPALIVYAALAWMLSGAMGLDSGPLIRGLLGVNPMVQTVEDQDNAGHPDHDRDEHPNHPAEVKPTE